MIFSEAYFVDMIVSDQYFYTPDFVNLIHKFFKDLIEKHLNIKAQSHSVTYCYKQNCVNNNDINLS